MDGREYLKKHDVQATIAAAVAHAVREKPADCIQAISDFLVAEAERRSEPTVETHQASEVQANMEALRACAAEVSASMGFRVKCTVAPEGCTAPPEGAKLIHFIRHGACVARAKKKIRTPSQR